MSNIIVFIIDYLLGSIPSGYWIGKWFYHLDIREFGSGNMGTTNTFRVLGRKAGIIVLVMDLLKGSLAMLLAMNTPTTWHPLIFGFAPMIGHTYPVFAHFKGGKAVATLAGVMLTYIPTLTLSAVVIFLVLLWFTRMVSVSSIVTISIGIVLTIVFKDDWFLTMIVSLADVFIIYRHRTNIKRILNGTESKVPFGFGYKKEL